MNRTIKSTLTAILAVLMLLAAMPSFVTGRAAADMDGDGAITTIDALMIMRVSLGLG